MGYYMRYFMTDGREITLPIVEAALRSVDPAYQVVVSDWDDFGDLLYADLKIAVIEINRPDDEIFQDDVAEFQDVVGNGDNPVEQRVRDVLAATRAIIAVEALWEDTNSETTLVRIDPLWDWLYANRDGLSQADGEGFYDRSGLILERHFTL
jgi:hypothetical protein